jgi:hypothetical protein
MKVSALYLAAENDEWEEIEYDEVIQDITAHIHVCAHQQYGSISIFEVRICQDFL